MEWIRSVAWETGMIIGHSQLGIDPSSFVFEALTRSRYGHIGVIVCDRMEGSCERSNPYVCHIEPGGFKKTPLVDYLSTKVTGGTTLYPELKLIKLRHDIPKDSLRRYFERRDISRLQYNYKFTPNPGTMYCSELVYSAFFTAVECSIGEFESIEALNLSLFARWGIVFPIPRGTQVIIPASIMRSPLCEIVWEKPHGVADPIGDDDLIHCWGGEAECRRAISEALSGGSRPRPAALAMHGVDDMDFDFDVPSIGGRSRPPGGRGPCTLL